jgi:hypothetical protein
MYLLYKVLHGYNVFALHPMAVSLERRQNPEAAFLVR